MFSFHSECCIGTGKWFILFILHYFVYSIYSIYFHLFCLMLFIVFIPICSLFRDVLLHAIHQMEETVELPTLPMPPYHSTNGCVVPFPTLTGDSDFKVQSARPEQMPLTTKQTTGGLTTATWINHAISPTRTSPNLTLALLRALCSVL